MLTRMAISVSIILALAFPVSFALAQENLVLKKEEKQSDKKKLGWVPSGKVGINASFTSSSNVVGKADGSNETYGLDLNGAWDFADKQSEWRNRLSYTGSLSKTVVQPRYVKSSDMLKAESLFLYSFESMPNVGPYVKLSGSAPLFFGEDVRASNTTYNVKHLDNTTTIYSGSTFKLTDGFKPLTTRESAGVFWKAFNDGNVKIETRMGIGAEHTMAAGQFAVTGTDASGSVSIDELRNLSQLGVEIGLTGKGQINETTGWEIGVETLTPFVTNKENADARDPFRLTNIDGFAKLTSNLTSWASIGYDYKVTIKPQLVDRTQQSHMLVFNVNYNLF